MQRINQCLNTKLAEIYKRAMAIGQLNGIIIHYLPENLRDHFTVGSFSGGNLVLITTNPIWASQLRYHLPDLRDILRKDAGLYQLASIKINVAADAILPTAEKSSPRYLPLSASARETIMSSSEQCDYGPLKTALKHLAENYERRL